MTTLKTAVPGVTITETGLLAPNISDVLAGRLTDIDTAFGGGVRKILTSPQGQLASSEAEIIAEVQDKLLCLFNQVNPDYAAGRFQDGIGRIYFMDRVPGRGTLVTATCIGAVRATIPAGSLAVDDAGYQYASVNDEIIGPDGRAQVVFQNTQTGAIPCGSGKLNQIYRAVPGWDAITNDAPGVLGNEVESRAAFETRRRQSVAKNAQNIDLSILSQVLGVPGVVDAYVWSNRKPTIVTQGATHYPVKPKSVFISVYGGANSDIANAIFIKANPGVDFNGDITVEVEQKELYSPPYPKYEITWLRATPTRVYFKVAIQDVDNLPSDIDTMIKAAITDAFNGNDGTSTKAGIGTLIGAGRYYAVVTALGEINLTSITLSLDGIAWQSSVTMGIDQMPTLQDSDIDVVVT